MNGERAFPRRTPVHRSNLANLQVHNAARQNFWTRSSSRRAMQGASVFRQTTFGDFSTLCIRQIGQHRGAFGNASFVRRCCLLRRERESFEIKGFDSSVWISEFGFKAFVLKFVLNSVDNRSGKTQNPLLRSAGRVQWIVLVNGVHKLPPLSIYLSQTIASFPHPSFTVRQSKRTAVAGPLAGMRGNFGRACLGCGRRSGGQHTEKQKTHQLDQLRWIIKWVLIFFKKLFIFFREKL